METTFSPEQKPQLEDMSAYFNSRLRSTGDKKGIRVSTDTSGNSLYTSLQHSEDTLDVDSPAMLAVSPDGKQLILRNRGLLKQIADPPADLPVISEGSEGRIYLLSLNTPKGTEDFALKYTFGMDGIEEKGSTTFTPGVDQMRLLQLMGKEQPIPGLHYATPVMASLDMTLSPLVPGTLSTAQLFALEFIWKYKPDELGAAIDRVSNTRIINLAQQQMLKEIFNYEKSHPNEFLSKFLATYKTAQHGLYEWLESNPQVQELPFVTARNNINFVEAEIIPNIAGSVPAIYEFFKRYKDNPAIISENDQAAFQTDVRNCIWLIEAMKGQNNIKENNSPRT